VTLILSYFFHELSSICGTLNGVKEDVISEDQEEGDLLFEGGTDYQA
jgi:hypothetical protein